ncbi:hypothetical protein CKO44_15070 [Rubrivivax gelatinosus]|uniref:DUF2894 family protein n=1 Tax=Rubrivivax gelatinosus TaxID=28068 RepID=A0ABS1DS18_RUBGE|nr:DUF2894 domain-containing protein [Rubrivivax gelatinosus]MBK1614790.1 hypothetical protein [Rubrivivax gelatinosus]MBK1711980.1 hypothetical protein [Rubrivivax gelatinosus]
MNEAPEHDPLAAVQAWSRRTAPDAVTLAIAQGLARRAATAQGTARQLLLARLHGRIAAESGPAAVAAALPHAEPALAGLVALVERLGRAATPVGPDATAPRLLAAEPRPLRAVAAFQGTWQRLKTDHRLRQAMAEVPANAGPLHSSRVVHRMLETLRESAPAYLEALIGQAETLALLEQELDASLKPGRGDAGVRGKGGRR